VAPRIPKAARLGDRSDAKEPRGGKAERAGKSSAVDWVRYRIEVGRRHEVTPGNIVGAIANEAGIDSQFIGQIRLHDDYSTVDLPEGMPQEVFRQLKQVRVCQQKLNIRRDDTVSQPGEGGRDGDRPLKVKTPTAGKSHVNKTKDKPPATRAKPVGAKARSASKPLKERKRRQLHLPR
jgi:ATP-dependent RNA helicase DeaD